MTNHMYKHENRNNLSSIVMHFEYGHMLGDSRNIVFLIGIDFLCRNQY